MMTKTTLFFRSFVTVLALGGTIAGTALAITQTRSIEFTSIEDAVWTPLMNSALPATAPIRGDAATGAHEMYFKGAAGFVSPPHSHTNDYWAVVVKGKMAHWAAQGGSEKSAKQLGVGDLTFMPAKVEHVSKCFPGEDCLMVIIQRGKFDFVPAAAKR
jgi:quercetin dioxygenase-like cupin family protein